MKFYYFNSTHWDREWYQPFQRFRRYLVATADGILSALEKDETLKQFTFDGQTIVLEDVLEIHPEWRERFARQIRRGRLNVGPWYVMPDEFLVSAESLIRNLLIGREIARSFGGEPWQTGYICDIFGHMAQMPQIFHGFGLAPAVLWRGANSRTPAFFLWEAPDGSRCETIHLIPRNGYADFTLWVTGWWNTPLAEADFKQRFQKEAERLKQHFGPDNLILSDALDHIEIHAQTPQYLQWIRELYPDAEVIHTNYRETLEIFRESEQPVIRGELISPADVRPADGLLITHTLSSRYDVKAAHDLCQNRLELESDPLLAYLNSRDRPELIPFWRHTWKQFIKNQAHDSICGCAVDAVSRQMHARFEEINQICDTFSEDMILQDRARITGHSITRDARTLMIEEPPSEADPDGNYLLNIYNPLPFERDELIEAELRFPVDSPYPRKGADGFGYEWVNNFRLYDEAGRELPYQLKRIRHNQMRNFYRHDSRSYDCYPVQFRTRLAACGWSRIQVKAVQDKVRFFAGRLQSRRSASNGKVSLAINADGTFDLQDLRTGRVYSSLNDISIDREIGDGWNHVQPVGGGRLAQSLSGCSVSVKEDGPVLTVFEVVRKFELPRELTYAGTIHEAYDGIAESAEYATLTVTSRISLGAEDDFVDVQTAVFNTVRDCRVRLSMASGIPGDYFAYQNYAFLTRPAGRATGNESEPWQESEPLEKNFSGIAGKRDDQGGIAFLAKYGLHEMSCPDWENGEMFFTLYRAFRRTVGTDGESDCQLERMLHFEYRFSVISPDTSFAELHGQLLHYRSAPISYMLAQAAVAELPGRETWIALDGELSFGALKPAQDGADNSVVLRVVNLSDRPAAGRLTLSAPARLRELNLDETAHGELQNAAQKFELNAAPWKILTYQLIFSNEQKDSL